MKNESPLPPRLYSSNREEYPKKLPMGIYDPSILCEDCEQKFNPWDDYACGILTQEFEEGNFIKDPQGIKVGYEIKSVNYDYLKLFFLSLLWRAAVSSRPEFSRINTAPYVENLRRMIQENDAGDCNTFSVVLAKFDHSIPEKGFLDPHRSRYDGINFCRFYFYGFTAEIKTDKKPTPAFFTDLILKPNHSLFIIMRMFQGSRELTLMKNILKGR